MRALPLFCSLLFAVPPAAQDLRRGLLDADAVVVGRQVGRTRHGDQLDLHRLQVLHPIRGAGGAGAVTVLDWPQLGLHQRPSPRQSRLYCLQDASATAARLGLPPAQGPYYKMVGWAGSSPLIGAELDADPVVRFARVLARSEAGARPLDTAAELCRIALEAGAPVRTEAARLLGERPELRAQLAPLQWSQLLARAGGELEDVGLKIALAELCAEQRLEGLLDTLAVSLGPVQDADYARAVGRIGRLLHGEQATERLQERLVRLAGPQDRAMVLLAIGATNTESALELLLRCRNADRADRAVEAALAEHRSPRAREAAGKPR
ncbi:MAG: hypothetical protein FJ265_02555 [Planctomycetes bacterium]|nr:hypothetical protein [Planctomycetota bacterium]